MLGYVQVMLLDPVRFCNVKVTGGGVGKMLSVAVALQPSGSVMVIVVMPTGSPVACNEFAESEAGIGLHVMTGLTDADPAAVTDAAESVLVHPD